MDWMGASSFGRGDGIALECFVTSFSWESLWKFSGGSFLFVGDSLEVIVLNGNENGRSYETYLA